jgi:hypothetical protein
MGDARLRRSTGSDYRGQHVFEVQIYIDDLDPNAVRVELYADEVNGGDPMWQEMTRVRQLANAPPIVDRLVAFRFSNQQQCPLHI